MIHLDLETYSDVPIEFGTFRYAEGAEILIAAIAENDDEPVLWVNPKYTIPGVLETHPDAYGLLDQLAHEDAVCAHNAEFEEALMAARAMPDMGLVDPIPVTAWRCTAAMARRAGLRPKLAHLSEDLGLDSKKYATGASLIPFFCVPQKDGSRNLLHDHPEKARRFADYCLQDVRAEQEVFRRLKAFELKGDALETFQLTGRLNRRGIPVNVPALRHAQALIDEVEADLGVKFYALTGLRHTQRAKVFEWLRARGYTGADMTADTVEEQLARTDWPLRLDAYQGVPEGLDVYRGICEDDELGHRALTIYAQLAYAAAKKVTAMLDSVCEDGTVKGTLVYHGAGTGRWSGRGIQPQNFKKPTINGDLQLAWGMVSTGTPRETIELTFGPALEVVASVIRNFIGLPCGLWDADYNAVEARIANWLGGEEKTLARFRKMDAAKEYRPENDLYLLCYCDIMPGVDVRTLTKKGKERGIGKVFELAAQYNLGPQGAFNTAESWGTPISMELATKGIATYRKTHPYLVRTWKAYQRCAEAAIEFPGVTQVSTEFYPKDEVGAGSAIPIKMVVKPLAGMPYLLIQLPSGRCLTYPKPEVEPKWVDATIPGKEGWWSKEITYWGQPPMKSIMGRIKLYGGKIMENISQAIGADLMTFGTLKAEGRGYDPITFIHDQLLAAASSGTAEGFGEALASLPPWAAGLPLKAESGHTPYYTKD